MHNSFPTRRSSDLGDFDTQENSPGQTPEYEGIRLFSPGGQRLAEDNTDYRKCMSNVWNWRSMSPSLPSLDNCGVGIVYDVQPKSGNDDLVKMFTVAVVNQAAALRDVEMANARSEEHTSELQSLMRISYAVSCLKKKKQKTYKQL